MRPAQTLVMAMVLMLPVQMLRVQTLVMDTVQILMQMLLVQTLVMDTVQILMQMLLVQTLVMDMDFRKAQIPETTHEKLNVILILIF